MDRLFKKMEEANLEISKLPREVKKSKRNDLESVFTQVHSALFPSHRLEKFTKSVYYEAKRIWGLAHDRGIAKKYLDGERTPDGMWSKLVKEVQSESALVFHSSGLKFIQSS
jgi:hypothetical protein